MNILLISVPISVTRVFCRLKTSVGPTPSLPQQNCEKKLLMQKQEKTLKKNVEKKKINNCCRKHRINEVQQTLKISATKQEKIKIKMYRPKNIAEKTKHRIKQIVKKKYKYNRIQLT